MSFGLTSDDLRPHRLKAALPLFSVLLIFVSLVLVVLLLSARERLGDVETGETTRLLNSYLQKAAAAPLWFGSSLPLAEEQLGGLAFVRISRDSNRLLLTDETIGEGLFHELLRLDPPPHQPWLQLASDDDRFWAVVSRTLPGGVVLFAGRESTGTYTTYGALRNGMLGAWLLALPAAALVSLWLAARQAAPLVRLCRELEQLVEGGQEQLLKESPTDTDRGRLVRQLNALIRQNRRLVHEMQASLDNVAHDLRTPMTRLRSVAEFGLREEHDTDKLRASLADCLEESERVLSMLRIMMSVAEAETGTIRLELEPLDLAASIGEMVELYEYVAEEQQITLATQVSAGLTILADKTRIAQVWANLLDNGIKYGRQSGWVKVEAERLGTVVHIRFVDNGMGISAGEQPRIWERLYRGDRSRTRQGLGLGLNFVKAIVEAHGGRVRVESVLHEGSCFTVELPLAGEDVDQPTMEKSQTSGE